MTPPPTTTTRACCGMDLSDTTPPAVVMGVRPHVIGAADDNAMRCTHVLLRRVTLVRFYLPRRRRSSTAAAFLARRSLQRLA